MFWLLVQNVLRVGFMLNRCSMVLVIATSVLACGDSGTGGSGAGGANPGGSNAGASNPGGSNAGGSNAGGSNAGGANVGGDGSGGGTPCDEPLAELLAKIEKCPTMPVGGGNVGGGNVGGGSFGGGNEGGGKPFDCTPDTLALLECVNDCYQAATCAAIDGSDPKAQSVFSDCLVLCSP